MRLSMNQKPHSLVIGTVLLLFGEYSSVYQVDAQAFVDCSSERSFSSIAGTGTRLPGASTTNGDDDVSLPFAFQLPDGNSYSTWRVDSTAYIFPPSATAYIDVAYDFRVQPGDVYFEDKGTSAVISWEKMNLNGGTFNAQATLFPNGGVALCYGTGNNPASTPISAELEDDAGTEIEVEVIGFVDGITSSWPSDMCACYNTPPVAPLVSCVSSSEGKGGRMMKKGKKSKTEAPGIDICSKTKSPGKGRGRMMMRGKKD